MIKRKRRQLPSKVNEEPTPPNGFTSYGYWRGWNPDGTPEIINDGQLITPFVPQTWHASVYGGKRK